MDIVQRIKLIMNKFGLNQTKFSEISGIKQSNLSKILSGERTCGEAIINKIVLSFDINKDWLLTGEGEMLNSTEVGVFQRGSPPGYVSLPKEVYEQMLQTIKSQQGVIELLGDVIKKTNARTDTNAECAAAVG